MTDMTTPTVLLIAAALVLLTVVQVVWVRRRYDAHRIRHFFGFGEAMVFGRFHWREGVWEGEVRRALSPDYVKRNGWLLSKRMQRALVVLNVASWLLFLFGAFDVSWNLGFATSRFSWWGLLVVVAYLMVRQSVRVVADAPDELIDERMRAQRDRAVVASYRIFGWLLPAGLCVAIGATESAEQSITFDFDDIGFMFFIPLFIYSALPSMVLAWRGGMAETDVNEDRRTPA